MEVRSGRMLFHLPWSTVQGSGQRDLLVSGICLASFRRSLSNTLHRNSSAGLYGWIPNWSSLGRSPCRILGPKTSYQFYPSYFESLTLLSYEHLYSRDNGMLLNASASHCNEYFTERFLPRMDKMII